MDLINIRRDVPDKFYRYKMPRIISKIEGRGNGIKTVIPNMVDVARALRRPPIYTTKYFGTELGSQATCDTKNDKYIVNGAHDAEKLQTLLDGFITKFVLCPSCLNPETDLVITKDEDVIKDCKACGATKPVDMRHKLTSYIIKNPPEDKKKSKKTKKSGDATPNDGTPQQGSDEEDNQVGMGDDDEITRRINEEVAQLPDAVVDDDWAEDIDPEAVARRMKELSVQGAVSKMLDDQDDDLEDPLEEFASFVTDNPTATANEVYAKAQELEVREDRAAAVLAQVLFDEKISGKLILAKKPILAKFLKNEKSQKAFLGGIERLVGHVHIELLPKIAVILKGVYDADLIDEEVFLTWGSKPSRKYVDKSISKQVRAKAEPFLKWLREADEEESDEDDDE